MLAAADMEIFSATTTFAIMRSLRLDRGPSGPVHPWPQRTGSGGPRPPVRAWLTSSSRPMPSQVTGWMLAAHAGAGMPGQARLSRWRTGQLGRDT